MPLYEKWRQTYEDRKLEFLIQNEKLFGRHLRTARKGIYVPEEVTPAYRSHIDGVLQVYTENYHDDLEKQIKSGAKFELAGATLLGVGFVAALKGRAEPVDTVEKIAQIVAKDALSNKLPSGLTLSERVWDLNYEKDIISIVQNGLTNNLSPEILAKQLDNFILPGRNVETLTPYGRTLNFDSMRLARTEVMASFRRASTESINRTPWITGQVWTLSDAHQVECDCDGMEGQVYTDGLPDGPHPSCGCYGVDQVLGAEEWDSALQDYYDNGTDELGIAEWLSE